MRDLIFQEPVEAIPQLLDDERGGLRTPEPDPVADAYHAVTAVGLKAVAVFAEENQGKWVDNRRVVHEQGGRAHLQVVDEQRRVEARAGTEHGFRVDVHFRTFRRVKSSADLSTAEN